MVWILRALQGPILRVKIGSLDAMDVRELLESKAKALSYKPAVIFKEQSITFVQVRDFSFRLADSLMKLGIRKGDKVAIYLPNCPEYIYSYLAVWCCGLTSVPLDFMLIEEEVASCIRHAEAIVLIAKSKPNLSFSNLRQNCPTLKHIIVCAEKKESCLSFEELLEKGNERLPEIKTQDKDYAIIFYTSGTTGRPKGVLINYLQLEAPPQAMTHFVDFTDRDIALCALPFSHLGGLIYLENCLVFGITVVLLEHFIPLEFLKNIPRYRVTCFWLVPSMYYAFLQLKEFENLDFSSLRWIVNFGASSSPDALRRFHQYCPKAHFLHGWGLTETNAPTTVIPMGSEKLESVGKPAPWIEVKIFNENDKEISQGQVGEIVVRGWVVTDGYYKDPQATASCMVGGWFHSGDLGRLDSEGYLYIVGRKKEMLKVGGEIVFEPEIESVLHKHPDVVEAAVVGVPDNLRGEVPKAFVTLKEVSKITEEDLRYFCRQHLAHFKIPHYFEFITSLPKNRAGKIDKEKLRDK